MKLLKELGVRNNGKRGYMWGLFECPKCNAHIERMKHQGLKQEQCQECFRIYHKETQIKHGDRYTRLYRTWINMRARCYSISNDKYANYGGRGITICNDWNDYILFKKWALENGYNDSLTIDRINANGNYEPDNCRFITNNINAGKDKIVINNSDFDKIKSIIKQGVSVEKAYTSLGFNRSAYYGAKKRYENK